MTLNPKKPIVRAMNIAELTRSGREALSSLVISNAQEDLGGTFEGSVSEWERADEGAMLGLSFHVDDEPVGIVLLKRPPLSPLWVPEDAVSLHGLKIAEAHQGQGLGRIAFGLALDAVGSHWPVAHKLVLSVDAGNEPALAVYRGYGMKDSGPIFRGRIGFEHRLELQIRTSAAWCR